MMQLVKRNVKIKREQAGHLDQKSIGQSALGAILWRINMLYPIMALMVDLDSDLVGIAVFIRISG